MYDLLLWYARSKPDLKYRQLYQPKGAHTHEEQYTLAELSEGRVRRLTEEEPAAPCRFRKARDASCQETCRRKARARPRGLSMSTRVDVTPPPPGAFWKTTRLGLDALAAAGRLHPIGIRLRYKRFVEDFPWAPPSNLWDNTVIIGFGTAKLYSVQTSHKVVERCIAMTTDPGDLLFDSTCGSGATAFCDEKLGRRWITCDTLRVAINVARKRLLSATFEHYKTRNGKVSGNFTYKTVNRVTLKSLAYDLEPEKVELVGQPEVDQDAIGVCGPLEVMSLGRYSVEDWKGYVVREAPAVYGEPAKLENYIETICRLYRKDAAIQGASGLVHAVAENEKERIAISVGPLSGRVTAKLIHDAVQDAIASGILEAPSIASTGVPSTSAPTRVTSRPGTWTRTTMATAS